MRHQALLIAVAVWVASIGVMAGQLQHPSMLRNHPAIRYGSTPSRDAVALLNERLKRGDASLERRGPSGYLQSILEALQVPVESQLLVFSKTSFQADKIGPKNPRALYFGDTVAVGWVRGSDVLEFVAQDPAQGAVFYTMSQASDAPVFERNDSCVSCHSSETTHYVPGMFIGSVFPGLDGRTMYGPAYTTDHRSPFEFRWGGWFVTGTHTASRHMGNAVAADGADLIAMITPQTVHVTDLEGRFDRTGYLSRHSDLVALLVIEHQAKMLNLLTRVGWEARIGEKESGRTLERAASELVDYLLFVDEAPLPGPITGTTRFAEVFSARGPRDSRGRSLRDLSLETRLLRYPCSYLIYSEPFDGLPANARAAVYDRLWDILSGQERDRRYATLTAADRAAILQILTETKPDIAAYFATRRSLPDTP